MDDLVIQKYLREKSNIAQEMTTPEFVQKIDALVGQVCATYDNGGRIFIMANGGTAGTADHIAMDLMTNPYVGEDKGVSVMGGEERMEVHSLSNASLITGIGNDFDFNSIFREQLVAYNLYGEDLVIGLSGSGNSGNILSAFDYADEVGAATCCISGRDGGRGARSAGISIVIPGTSEFPGQTGPNDNNFHIEDFQMSIGHILTGMLKAHVQTNAS
jgi:D-sedoheptulose 7-phosphate isomerase